MILQLAGGRRMEFGRVWAAVLVLLVATAAVTEAKRGKNRGKKGRKFGGRGTVKNFKTEASRAYYNHNGVSMCVYEYMDWPNALQPSMWLVSYSFLI